MESEQHELKKRKKEKGGRNNEEPHDTYGLPSFATWPHTRGTSTRLAHLTGANKRHHVSVPGGYGGRSEEDLPPIRRAEYAGSILSNVDDMLWFRKPWARRKSWQIHNIKR